MSYRKTVFGSVSSYSMIIGLIGPGFTSLLFAPMAFAATSSPLTTIASQAAKTPSGQDPIIALVLQQLGVTPQPQPVATSKEPEKNLSSIEKIKLAYDADHPASLKKPLAKPIAKAKLPKPFRLKSQANALAAFYLQPGRRPVWVSQKGQLNKTNSVIDEFNHADSYGLRPQDFSLSKPGDPALIGKMEKPLLTDLARLEISMSKTALKYARYAKGGRIDPKKLSRFQDRGPSLPDPEKVLATLASSADPAQTLRSFHPPHPQFEALRKKLVSLSTSGTAKGAAKPVGKLSFPQNGATLRLGMKHAHVALLRKRLRLKQAKGQVDPLEFDIGIEAAVKAFQKKNDLGSDGVVGRGTRRVLSGAPARTSSPDKVRARLLINMERWRWMPKKLQGNNNIYVWANVPELKVRIIREGKTIFTEKAIAGQLSKQSPMFSDKMEWIEFNPTWYIPNSIKVADILPSLRKKGRVMNRYHLRINCGKHGTDFRKIDWKKVDIRKCAVIQPTGAKSVLGKLKFKFPNKHAVYMHDTLTPNLFNRKHRILSHGCIRVKNPRRMAEVLLANDKGMSAQRVGSLLARGGLHTERLKRSIPVHITYFSTRVNANGTLTNSPDYYGHDKRLAQAMLKKGHLFRGAIYSGRKKYKRKPRPKPAPSPSVNPAFFPEQ